MNHVNRESSRADLAGRQAFTLVELLVVIAVIAVFLSVIGLALNRGGQSAGLDSSQRMLSALVSGARSQAVMKQTPMYLLVSVDPGDPDTFLRSVQIATQVGMVTNDGNPVTDAFGNNIPELRLNGSPTQLSRGIFVVPSLEAVNRFGGDAGTIFGQYDRLLRDQNFSIAQIEERKSTGTFGDVEILRGNSRSRERFLYFRFDARGFTDGGYRIVLSPGDRGPNAVAFTNPNQASGFLVRPLGSVTMISDPRGFDEGQAQ